ncbi:MAG: hypothetical protein WCA85_30615 [Paraburkholderia sp.]|uniref:hypothetical protein n=1 Tax=Paraburkholderia sp. TaxID=1926495 RepID=UPI003C57F50D
MKAIHYRYLMLLMALVTFIWMACFFMPFPADFEDSYIMHRYAQNGVDGFLYEWNRNSGPVQGTTGVAWLTLVTLLAKLTRFNVISVNSYTGLIFAILTLLTIYAASIRNFNSKNRWIALCPLIPIISSPYFVVASGNGLETSITLFFVAFSIYLLRTCRASGKESIWLGLFSGFMALVRPDLPLFPLSLFLCAILLSPVSLSQRVKHGGLLLLGALAAGLLSLFLAKISTGTALPLSASLKFALTDLLLGRLPGSQYNYIAGYQLSFLGYLTPLIILALISTILLGVNESRKYLPIYGACVVYYAYLFSVLPIMDVAYRFQLPLLIGISFSIVHFYDFIVKSGVAEKRGYILLFGIALLLAFGNAGLLSSEKKDAKMLHADHGDFAEIGKNLSKFDGISIASPEAGKLAAFSEKKFFDTVGLNDRFVAENKNKANYAALLSNYLHSDFGMPDVYVRKLDTDDPKYTFLEILPDFKEIYVCNNDGNQEHLGKVICVYKLSSHFKPIISSLAELGIELPAQ